MQKALHRKGLALDSAFTVKMPSNYIIGFDVDPQEMVQSILSNAEKKLKEINTVIGQRQKGVYDTIPGKSPALKSNFANPLFNRFAMNTKKFYATDQCNGCKKCERICPLHTISVADKPVWGQSCTQCLACINNCPTQAIQYGKTTVNRGRYVHPKTDEK